MTLEGWGGDDFPRELPALDLTVTPPGPDVWGAVLRRARRRRRRVVAAVAA
ncbi:MAG: hypothetical protein JWP11_911, partial [Frankiales bacterium]|nr:hypothetical protein [Frankiales bacterium]